MPAYLTLPSQNTYVPSTLGHLVGQTLAQCQTACMGIPNCIGITAAADGTCEFMQLSDIGKLGTSTNPGTAAETSYLNCTNLCPGSTATCSPTPKLLGIDLYIWLALLSLALALSLSMGGTK